MDFFDHQEKAKKRTAVLVSYFLLAIAGIIAVLQWVFSLVLDMDWRDPELLMWVAGGVLTVVMLGSLAKLVELSHGGRVVALMLGGEQVFPNSEDPGERMLMNVVEEMAIASGVPVPEVFLLPDASINAFAAGHTVGDAAIGVTRGAVSRLTRDELQGVIAHEFSHILHGDMRLNIRLMALLNGILCLAFIGGLLMRITFYIPSNGGGRSDDRRGGGGLVFVLLLVGVALYLVGWIGVFFGNLIKAAVSRQREFLADAAAVQFTRNPLGLAGALHKISRFTSRLGNPRASEASHMYFGNGMGDFFFGMFATHPPIAERIRQIAPDFDPSMVRKAVEEKPVQVSTTPPKLPVAGIFGAEALPTLGAAILGGLPEFSRSAARETASAGALVFSLLLSEDATTRESQLGLVADESVRALTREAWAHRGEVSGMQRLALVDLSMPALRQMSMSQYEEFKRTVEALAAMDGQIDLFEFVLQKVLVRHLDRFFVQPIPRREKYRSIMPLLPQINVLLSVLARSGHSDEAAQSKALEDGVRELLFKPSSFPMVLGEEKGIADLGAALDEIALAAPDVKKTILKAAAQTIASDGEMTGHEYEIIRAIADALDCPMPALPDFHGS
ncbi:MAG: M48 family metallopeptidase [Terrimicrobiaceae bacterium]